ncbi:unnamed protein product [Haemonchus placei]|uniref:Uncharacterized protein n=1 Tax=Haemonchus placei TaxID=6290 RepID=A0A0N4VRV3_HAEPC|nr:unnamed protein product [Haemonchus placei]
MTRTILTDRKHTLARVPREHRSGQICSSRHHLRSASIRPCSEGYRDEDSHGYEEDEISQSNWS